MAKIQKAYRLEKGDLAVLSKVKKLYGLSSNSEALRLLLRSWADQHGYLVTNAGLRERGG